MNKSQIFKGFVKTCDVINKIYSDEVIFSEGVIMWLHEKILSILTLHEKLEKDIIPFLRHKFIIDPKHILFIDKYFEINDIEFEMNGIKFIFTGQISEGVLSNKLVDIILPLFSKIEDGKFSYYVSYIDNTNDLYSNITSMIIKISEYADFDNSTNISDLDKDALMKGNRPFIVDQNGYYIRLAKSIFQSITKKDKISMTCSPYTDNNNIFLCKATVSKDMCLLVNIFNVLRI